MISRLIFAHEQGLLTRAAVWDGDKGHLFSVYFSLLHCTLDATVAHYPPLRSHVVLQKVLACTLLIRMVFPASLQYNTDILDLASQS